MMRKRIFMRKPKFKRVWHGNEIATDSFQPYRTENKGDCDERKEIFGTVVSTGMFCTQNYLCIISLYTGSFPVWIQTGKHTRATLCAGAAEEEGDAGEGEEARRGFGDDGYA